VNENISQLTKTNDTLRDASGRVTIYDACMPLQWHNIIHVPNVVDKSVEFAYVRKGTGQYSKCVDELTPLLDKGVWISFTFHFTNSIRYVLDAAV
jgi:hypothetical protein